MALSATCLWTKVNEIKPWLKMDGSGTSEYDQVLEMLANAVTEELEAETERIYLTRSITETRHGDGTTRLWLRGYPVTAVSALTVDSTAVTTDVYYLDATPGCLVRKSGVWNVGVGNIVCTYTAGYAKASIPQAAIRVALEMLKLWHDEWNANAISASSINVGVNNLIIKPAWPYHVREAMNRLRSEYRAGFA